LREVDAERFQPLELFGRLDAFNARGGVHGRKLHLVSRDDGYDRDPSVVQTTKLIEEDGVVALIRAVGTPTAIATVPISSARTCRKTDPSRPSAGCDGRSGAGTRRVGLLG
jgi:ABC-type branched-subunit amino acid transport system substrate-binding protein